jgi:hypothetical protein
MANVEGPPIDLGWFESGDFLAGRFNCARPEIA